MPKPLSELGIHWAEKSWREGQGEVVDRIHQTDKKFILLQGPTGFGKSGVAGGAAKWLPEKDKVWRQKRVKGVGLVDLPPQSGVLTATKQLQVQYLNDFDDWATEVKGRGNFMCLVERNVTAADAACTMSDATKCEMFDACPYYAQKREAEWSKLVFHSYQYFQPSANYTNSFSDQSLLVLDEAHLADDMLMNFVKCEVGKNTCDLFQIPYPKNGNWTWNEWQTWAEAFGEDLEGQLGRMVGRAEADVKVRRLFKSGQSLLRSMEMLKGSTSPWVSVPSLTGWEFMPVWIGDLAQQYLYRHGKKILMMSATILDYRTFAEILGINPNEVEFIDVPSPFPVGSKPVYYDPPMAVKGGKHEPGYFDPLLFGIGRSKGIYDIIRDNLNDKGLIHCVSFDVANAIYNNAPNDIRWRLLTHNTQNRLSQYEYFRESGEPLILLSPSMKEGVSLEDDSCRFIIVAKMPFPYLGSPQVASRMKTDLGKRWYPWKTMCDLIQMTGRGMRSAEDWCKVYIMDENFTRTFKQMRNYVPKYWKDDLHDVRGLL